MSDLDVNPMSGRSATEQHEPTVRAHPSHAEGTWTRVIELQAAKIPSAVFLLAAGASMMASAACEATGRHRLSRVVGMWAPTLLVAGVYNKLVKTLGTT